MQIIYIYIFLNNVYTIVLYKKKNNFYLIISLHMSRIIVFDFYNITTWSTYLTNIIYNVASTNCTNLFNRKNCDFYELSMWFFFAFKFLIKSRKQLLQ